MRKHILLTLLLAFGCMGSMRPSVEGCNPSCNVVARSVDHCACKASSHSFLYVRPLFQIGSPEHDTLFRWRYQDREDGCKGAIQIVPFGSRSTNPAHIATYFTPVCKTVLTVAENSATEQPDILSFQMNVRTVDGDFKSQLSFNPHHSEAGIGLSYKQGFCVDWCGCEKTIWFEISAPLMNVRNSLGFCENIIDDGGGVFTSCVVDPTEPGATCPTCFATNDDTIVTTSFANITEALSSSQFHCGRIRSCCTMSKTRLANLDLLFGYEAMSNENAHAESYFGVSLPTGNRVTSEYLFEPIVGHNHHTGLIFGSNVGAQLWCNTEEDRGLWLEASLQGMYLIRNCQKRIVDLKCKPWSRYMRYYTSQAQAEAVQNTNDFTDRCLNVPGVNIFCLDVKVHPGFQRTYNVGLAYTNCDFEGEIGYNFFARSAECVELAKPFDGTPALKSNATIGGRAGVTDRVQTINEVFLDRNIDTVANYSRNIIKQCDLDLESASNPALLTHTVYGSAGWHFDSCCYPMVLGLGGSYEFSRDNLGMDRWVLWGKYGITF